MATLEYSVTGQRISTTAAGRLVSGTIGYYTVKFTFDSVWNNFSEKWAVFDPSPGQAYKQPLDSNGECEIPGEVMAGVYLRIGVYGVTDGVEHPTVWANRLQMEEGCYVEALPSDWPEPSPILADVVRVTEQTFTAAEQEQARENIGAAGDAELAEKMDKPTTATPGNLAIIDDNHNAVDSGKSLADIYDSAMISKTVSGDIVTIEDGADGVPIKSMTIAIEPVQTGSGDPSPTNVRTISGWTGCSIKVSDEDTANPVAYIVTFPSEAGTVYGGSLTINEDGSGTLVASLKAVDMSTLNWSGDSITSAHRMLVTINDRRIGTKASGVTAWCESYDWYGTNTLSGLRSVLTSGQVGYRDTNGQTLIRNDSFSDVASFKASLSGQLLVYQMATPITYTLTAPQVQTLLGLNNIWADTGSIESLTYHADPTLAMEEQRKAIKQSIAPVEDSFTASQAYAVNDLVYVGDDLYRVTTAISSGTTMTPGTNITATTINTEIQSLR